MKKLINILLAASLLLVLASCDDEEPAVSLTLDNNTVSLNLNAGTPTASVSVQTGNGGYEAASSDNDVATASASGSTVTITAIGEGTATVTVTDSRGESANISVTVTYAIPTDNTFNWNGQDVEFFKVGAYGISNLGSSVALTDLVNNKKQYHLTWTGGLSEGDKTGGQLVIAENGKEPVTTALTSVKVVQAGTSGNYLVFSSASESGELFFTE